MTVNLDTRSATLEPESHGRPASRPVRRASALGGAMVAAAVTWVIFADIFGLAIRVPTYSSAPPTTSALGVGQVIATTLIAGLLALGVLAVVERCSHRPRRLWTVMAATVGCASLFLPLTAPAIGASTRLALITLHVVVSGVLIMTLRATVSDSDRSPTATER